MSDRVKYLKDNNIFTEEQKKLQGNDLLKILAIGGVAAFLLWALTNDNKPIKR
jgi:hypothetical protein